MCRVWVAGQPGSYSSTLKAVAAVDVRLIVVRPTPAFEVAIFGCKLSFIAVVVATAARQALSRARL
jgi:hypothetical protein